MDYLESLTIIIQWNINIGKTMSYFYWAYRWAYGISNIQPKHSSFVQSSFQGNLQFYET